MPPRKNIVKSGNAGTSSKAEKATASAEPKVVSGPPPLFPPNSKTPLSLLHERCQKNGWRPELQTFRRGDKFSAIVLITRRNPRTSAKESVTLDAHPPYEAATLDEAKHWAATYALYRFCNNIQLNRVLPVGPREYWLELAEEKRKAPTHQDWMYAEDPFAAKLVVEERQRKARLKSEKPPGADELDLSIFDGGTTLRMGTQLRDMVEAAIKQVSSEYPDVTKDGDTVDIDAASLKQQLSVFGFKKAQIDSAVAGLSSKSALASSLLNSLPPREAALEYLLLHTPEADLPAQFIPSSASSLPFVSSAHAGVEDIRLRWMEDRAVKDAGYPRIAVKEALQEVDIGEPATVFEILLRKLMGFPATLLSAVSFDAESQALSREGELEAIQSVYPEASFNPETFTLSVPLPTAPGTLNLIIPPYHPYPESNRLPLFYVASNTMAPYVRLHLNAKIVTAIAPSGEREDAGEGVCFNAIDAAEAAYEEIQASGPPDATSILRNLLPPPTVKTSPAPQVRQSGRPRPAARRKFLDQRDNERIRADFEAMKVNKEYRDMEGQRKNLPAWANSNTVVEMVRKNQVIIVVGETGCGKTTQLPQFILDAEIEAGRGSKTSVVITQPRRVSVLGVSARVSAERAGDVDGTVGYAIRGESRVKSTTKLLYCTTGVLLRRLASGDDLSDVSHIVVDEVHERSVDSDFLLLELKEMIKSNKSLKLVLMSATIDQKTFASYFDDAPVITIPGRTHPVNQFYLEDILKILDYRPTSVRGGVQFTKEQSESFRAYFDKKGISADIISKLETLRKLDRIDYQLVAAVVKYIVKEQAPGAILIFMPGVQEIKSAIEAIQALSIGHVTILPLHANLTSDEQKRVFSKTSGRKIVVATNVAETSITIDDVVYVIDGGKVKENIYDAESGLSKLEEQFVTRASANQRCGRAGRTQPGKCYRLFSTRDEENMRKNPLPEIQRVGLESLLLHVKVSRPQEDAKLYLMRAIDPPKLDAAESAWRNLLDLGAVDFEGNLSALGRHMALLPLDLRLGKMLILGAIFGCLSPIASIAACLSSKPLFISPMDKRDEATKARDRFSEGNSDLLTVANAVDQCLARRREGKESAVRTFCEENFISYQTFRDVASLRMDFVDSLKEIGFIPFNARVDDESLNASKGNANLVKGVVVGGLWPRVAKVVLPKALFDKVAAGATQREHQAKEVKYFDRWDGRVFLHPSSVLFSETTYQTKFIAFFSKVHTSKIFLRDVTEVPLYALLLFGGDLHIDHNKGQVTVGGWVQLKSAPRIGVLISLLRRLLDAQLTKSIDSASLTTVSDHNPVVRAMLALMSRDGLDANAL